MTPLSRRLLLQSGVALAACGYGATASAQVAGPYVCPPCDCPMHDKEFPGPGKCPACGMTLVPKSSVALDFEPSTLGIGSGGFQTRGGKGREDKRITVHYHVPRNFTPRSPILLVIPGAGRNSDPYRDAWVEASEAKGVLVAALSYPEADYDFAAYQMGGTIRDLVIRNLPVGANGQPAPVANLKDEDISFSPNPLPDEWLFNDFDRIFAFLKAASKSTQESYDIFGHSAGGQILHRLAIFHPRSKAGRIIAANAGLYSQPDITLPLPAGLKGMGLGPDQMKDAFAARLTLLVGELDNSGEEGGIQIHTPTFDRYGVDRLARSKTFFDAARRTAAAASTPFNWTLEIVPGVAHDFRGMTKAAGKLLYG